MYLVFGLHDINIVVYSCILCWCLHMCVID